MAAAISNILKETRSEILNCLKSKGHLSVEQLADAVGVSKVSVRRHLDLLGRDGLVDFEVRRRERGRPGHLYHLTEKATILFPSAYCDFALDLLKQIQARFGADAVKSVLSGLTDERMRLLEYQIGGLDFGKKVKKLFSIINDRGYEVTIRKLRDGSYLVRQGNCPTSRVASSYNQICEEELRLYSGLLGTDIRRECRIVEGSRSCDYRIFPPGNMHLVKLERLHEKE